MLANQDEQMFLAFRRADNPIVVIWWKSWASSSPYSSSWSTSSMSASPRWRPTVAKRFSSSEKSEQCQTTTWSFPLPGKFLTLFVCLFVFAFQVNWHINDTDSCNMNTGSEFTFFKWQGPVWAWGRQGAGELEPIFDKIIHLWNPF